MTSPEELKKESEATQLKFRMNKIIEEQISPALPKIAELKTVNEIDEALGKLVKELKLPKEWKDTHKFSIERVFTGFKVIFEKTDGERIFSGEIPGDWVTVEEVVDKKEAPKKEAKKEAKKEETSKRAPKLKNAEKKKSK